jgi:tRNA threonylcarbamoyladenosine modification (KEOPS) complex Cgi121 subunit
MKNEFIIWGKVSGSEEIILVSERANIKNLNEAKQIVKFLESKNCTEMRIQTIEFNSPVNFLTTIN